MGAIRLACAALVAAALTASRPAAADDRRSFVVDPSGTEDFSDLQTALDTVPAGSRLLVKGTWTDYRTWIRKSVTILGLTLQSSEWYYEWESDDALLEIDAGADADVTLVGLTMKLGRAYDQEGTRGIHVRSARNVVLSASTITCGSVVNDYCETYRRNGDGIVVDSAASLAVLSSTVTGGGPGWPLVFDCRCFCGDCVGPRGGHALLVQGSIGTLLIEESVLTGGGGGDVDYWCGYCGDDEGAGVPVTGGDGGSAVVHPGGVTYVANSLLTGGAAGHGLDLQCDPDSDREGQPGADVVGARADLVAALTTTAAVLGRRMEMDGRGFAPDRPCLLFSSFSIGTPLRTRPGPFLLAWPFTFLGVIPSDAGGSFHLEGTLPDDRAFEGVPIVFQATDLIDCISAPRIVIAFRP
jgi:hypothetical protein